MVIRGVRDLQEILNDLEDRIVTLQELLQEKDIMDTIMDDDVLRSVDFWLTGIRPAMLGPESNFYQMMYDLEDNMKDEHDSYEKIVFTMQKYFRLYLKESLIPEVEEFTEALSLFKVNDYRTRECLTECARKMELILDYYKTRYDLD